MTYTTERYRNNPVIHLPYFHKLSIGGLKLVPNFSNYHINTALIIQGPFSNRAANSAKLKGYEVKMVESFNYLDRSNDISPYEYDNVILKDVFPGKTYQNQSWIEQIRLRSRLTHNQICRILNHMSAWIECMKLTTPCIILEHDAILLDSKREHIPKSSIHCLSSDVATHHNSGWSCMGEAFAYSVDTHSSNRLYSKIMKEGLQEPLELLIRLDEFMILFERKSCRVSYANSSATTLSSSATTLLDNA